MKDVNQLIKNKSWLLPVLSILVIIYVSFFAGRYMDEFLNFHYLANDNPVYKITEGTYLGYRDPSLFFLGKYEYKMSFFYVGKASSLLFYPFYKIFSIETALSIFNLVFFILLCWLLKVTCKWRNWQVWAFAFAYPVLFAFLHDGGPLKVSALAFPLTAIAFQSIFKFSHFYKKVLVALLLGGYWCISLEDKIFFLYLLPSVIFFALSTLDNEFVKFEVLKKNIIYFIISSAIFLSFAVVLLSAIYYSPKCFWPVPANVTYLEALKIISDNQGGGITGLFTHSLKNIWNGIYQGHYFRIFYYFLYSSRALAIPSQFAAVAKAIAIGLLFSFMALMIVIIKVFLKDYNLAKKIKNFPLLFIVMSIVFFVLILSLNNIYKYNGHHFFYFWILIFQLFNLVKKQNIKFLNYAPYFLVIITSCFFYLLIFFSKPANRNTSAYYHSLGVKKYLDSLNTEKKYAINFSSLGINYYSERLLENKQEIVSHTLVQLKNSIPLNYVLYLKKNNMKLLNFCSDSSENENFIQKLPVKVSSKLSRVFYYDKFELRAYELDLVP